MPTIDKERYTELRKGILKDYHFCNYLLSSVYSIGSEKKIFLAEYPFCDYPYAVWEGLYFFDYLRSRTFQTLQEAMEDVDSRMFKSRSKVAKRYSQNVMAQDKISIKNIPAKDPYP